MLHIMEGIVVKPQMVSEWINVITPAGILIIVGFVFWRMIVWSTPRVEKFLTQTGDAIEKMPEAVDGVKDTIMEVGEKQTAILTTISDTQYHSIERNRQMLIDLMKAKRKMAEAILKLSHGVNVNVTDELDEIRDILSNHIQHEE